MRRKRSGRCQGPDTWGWRFQRRRDELGFSQKDISTVTGLTQQSVSRFENDEIVPRIETLEKYARSVGATVENLFPMELRPQGPSPAAKEGRHYKQDARRKRNGGVAK